MVKGVRLDFDNKTFILDVIDGVKSKVSNNVLILIKKNYIHRCRCQKNQLTVNALINNLKQLYKVFRFFAKDRSEMDRFNTYWENWTPVINSF